MPHACSCTESFSDKIGGMNSLSHSAGVGHGCLYWEGWLCVRAGTAILKSDWSAVVWHIHIEEESDLAVGRRRRVRRDASREEKRTSNILVGVAVYLDIITVIGFKKKEFAKFRN
ncbi:MAG: hypothetical protein LIQ31_14900 [Planctomycetes bacterium]|nr:hypothetical protein [Planctomycetota bacterium]